MPPQASDSPPEPFARPRFQDPGPSRLAKVQTITAHGLLTQASEDTQERAGRTGSVVSNLALAESRANVPCWGRWLLNVCPPLCQCACSLYAVVTTYRLCGIAILPQPLSLSVAVSDRMRNMCTQVYPTISPADHEKLRRAVSCVPHTHTHCLSAGVSVCLFVCLFASVSFCVS